MRGVLLQVRLDSSRLPEKALLPLQDLTVIEHAMRSLKEVHAEKYVVVTTEDSYSKLFPLTKKWGFDIFIGSKNNVLKRYVDAIDFFNLNQIVRATGDNPLVFSTLANRLIELHNSNNNDYSGFLNNPIGTGVEVVNSSVLKIALSKTTQNYDKEHVTPYIYNNKAQFKVFQGDAPEEFLFKNSFATIDTVEDFNRIEKLYDELYYGDIIRAESVIQWLKKEQLSYTLT
ncbi:MAG: hypothetical protein B6229_01950 [Spirochaetaceae bacterium 4572_7]|nr:MAG: hypothetical protein B6229_01950 [Spirochaetaceae bacterium 4572_7]